MKRLHELDYFLGEIKAGMSQSELGLMLRIPTFNNYIDKKDSQSLVTLMISSS